MLETDVEHELGGWTVEQCAFTIEYSPRVIDDIRLAVVDAFFSLPRGGAEIGGIFLGRNEGRRVTITNFAPLDCEHATGPSFVLSANDHAKLAALMASHRGNPLGTQPVGWYHSHTRSDIFLSAADIEIHQRYFPEPWQVALVLKPHTFQPAKAGFFFREADGSIHASASYREFELEPLALRTEPEPQPIRVPKLVPPVRPQPQPEPLATVFAAPPRPEAVVPALVSPIEEATQAEEAAQAAAAEIVPAETEPQPQPETVEVAPPAFTQAVPSGSSGGFRVFAALAAGLLLGAAGYQTRLLWIPRVTRAIQSSPSPAAHASVALTTLDTDGQLQIRWDREASALRNADEASLLIEDGPVPRAILLDSLHLRAGSFTYARQTGRVDVTLTFRGPSGQTVREATTYLGAVPKPAPPAADPVADKQRDAEERALRGRAKKLEQTVEDLKQELRQRKRLQNQSPDSAK